MVDPRLTILVVELYEQLFHLLKKNNSFDRVQALLSLSVFVIDINSIYVKCKQKFMQHFFPCSHLFDPKCKSLGIILCNLFDSTNTPFVKKFKQENQFLFNWNN